MSSRDIIDLTHEKKLTAKKRKERAEALELAPTQKIKKEYEQEPVILAQDPLLLDAEDWKELESQREAPEIKYFQGVDEERKVYNSSFISGTESSRAWMGTYYHDGSMIDAYTVDLRVPFRFNDDAIKYFIGQWEKTGTGKLHFHYVVIMKQPSKKTGVRRAIDCWKGQLEACKSVEGSLFYVSREDKRLLNTKLVEFGVPPPGQGVPQGKLDAMKAAIDGKSLTHIMEHYPDQYARYHAAINKVIAHKDQPRFLSEAPVVEIYYGPTGTGKSHKAFHENPGAYRKILAGKWWDGYDNNQCVIFEEFNPTAKNELDLPELLKAMDKYPYRVEIKGGSMQLKANKFIFTTNINPADWFDGHPQQAAFRRRVTRVLYFTTPGDSTQFQTCTFN